MTLMLQKQYSDWAIYALNILRIIKPSFVRTLVLKFITFKHFNEALKRNIPKFEKLAPQSAIFHTGWLTTYCVTIHKIYIKPLWFLHKTAVKCCPTLSHLAENLSNKKLHLRLTFFKALAVLTIVKGSTITLLQESKIRDIMILICCVGMVQTATML